MAIIAYLNFKGNTREAAQYYAEVFNSNPPNIMLYGDMPPDPNFPMTEDMKKLVMHTEINIGTDTVMFSDVPPDMPLTMGNNISLLVSLKDEALIKKYFERLSEGGQVVMPLQETFWSKLYGNLTDKFGIGWQFNLDKVD